MSYLLKVEEDELISSFGDDYKPDFADIPEHLKTERVAYDWLEFRAGFDFEEKASNLWLQIPHHLVTDRLRYYGISLDSEIIGHIQPSDTDHYLNLFINAHNEDHQSTKYLHSNFKTTSTIDAMMASPYQFERSYWSDSWIAKVMTADQRESAARVFSKIMVKLPVDQISTEALSAHLADSFVVFGMLRKEGKLRAAACFLKSHPWPKTANPFEHDEKEPKDALEAIEMIDKAQGENTKAVYMAWLMNQPIEHVIGLMTSRQQIKLALEMYSENELRPLMKNNRLLKGALLEETLGL
jgi:hypothetical protein